MTFGFFSVSGGEIILIFLVVLLLFGADKIPDIARMFGKGMNEVKRATDELKKEFNEGANEVLDDYKKSEKFIEREVEELKDNTTSSDPSDDLGGISREDDVEDREINTNKKRNNRNTEE